MTPDFNELVGDQDSGDDLESLRRVHDLLVSADPPPSPIIGRMARTPRVGPRVPRPRMAAALSFATAASVAIGLALGYTLGHGDGFQTAFSRPMHGIGTASAASAQIDVGRQGEAGNRTLEMTVRSLPKLAHRGWYELYLTKKGKPLLPCGTFETTSSGNARVTMNLPGDVTEYDGWNVTAVMPGHPPRVLLTT
jgi:hypothetical protein